MSTGGEPEAGALLERYALKAFVEACLILEDGVASAKDIDFGMVAGANGAPPLASADQAGLDAMVERLQRAAQEWGEDFLPPIILRRLVAQGRLGVKSGQGFFAYPRPDAGWEERPVKLETRGEVAIAWLDRPPANSISPEVLAALTELWEQVSASDAIRVLVFASANPMLFCAGADIKAFTAPRCHHVPRAGAERPRTVRRLRGQPGGDDRRCQRARAGRRLRAGHGLRPAHRRRFGQLRPARDQPRHHPRLRRDPAPAPPGGTGAALWSSISSAMRSAPPRPTSCGLVNRVVPDHELLDTALGWARKLAGQAPLAVAEIKRVSGADDLAAGIAAEKDAFVTVFGSEDASEGIAAFLGKRAPRWKGT